MIEHSKPRTSLLFAAALLAGLGGCSTLEKHLPGIGGSASATSGSAATAGVYYAAIAELPLYRSPGGAVIKRLPQYTKLYREQLDRGFAHVRVESTGETGWVENAQLNWRPPTQKPPQQAPEGAPQAAAETPLPQELEPPQPSAAQAVEAPESPSPAAVEAPPPAPAPSSTRARSTVAPSIFNPY